MSRHIHDYEIRDDMNEEIILSKNTRIIKIVKHVEEESNDADDMKCETEWNAYQHILHYVSDNGLPLLENCAFADFQKLLN